MTSEITIQNIDDVCPFGHSVSECGYSAPRKRCRIRRNELDKNHRAKLNKPRGRPRFYGAGLLNQRIGRVSEQSYYNKPIPIQLVCRHEVMFERNHISERYSKESLIHERDPDIWCVRCQLMKKIHQINGTHVGERALVVYPLEVPETDPPKYRLVNL